MACCLSTAAAAGLDSGADLICSPDRLTALARAWYHKTAPPPRVDACNAVARGVSVLDGDRGGGCGDHDPHVDAMGAWPRNSTAWTDAHE